MIKNSFLKRITVTSRCIDCGTLGIPSWLTVCPIAFRSQRQDPSCSSNPLGYWRTGVVGICHPLFVFVCRSHNHQDIHSYFLSDSGFIPAQTLSWRIPCWPIGCVFAKRVGQETMKESESDLIQPTAPVSSEQRRKRNWENLSFISNQIKIEGWRLALNLLIL